MNFVYGKFTSAGLMPLGCFVKVRDFKEKLQGQDHHVLTDSYFLCYLQCLGFIAQWVDFGQVGNVTITFDDKEGYKGETFKMYDVLKHNF